MQKVLEQEKDLGFGRMELLQLAMSHKAKSLSDVLVGCGALFQRKFATEEASILLLYSPISASTFLVTPGLYGAHLQMKWGQVLHDEQTHAPSISSCPFYLHCSFIGWLRTSLWGGTHISLFLLTWQSWSTFHTSRTGWRRWWHRCNRCQCLWHTSRLGLWLSVLLLLGGSIILSCAELFPDVSS